MIDAVIAGGAHVGRRDAKMIDKHCVVGAAAQIAERNVVPAAGGWGVHATGAAPVVVKRPAFRIRNAASHVAHKTLQTGSRGGAEVRAVSTPGPY